MHTIALLPLVAAFAAPQLSGGPSGQPSSQQSATTPAPDASSDRLVVTPTRRAQDPLEVPHTVQTIDAEQMARRVYRTVPQALRDVPGVLPQETAHGQGSPYIRGFTGYQTLLMVDGVRLNNSAFRSGPNQYWNTVDGSSLERLEVVKGPSSVLYGSDAVGGTVNAITRDPYIWDRPVGGRLTYRVSDGESSHVARLELGGAIGEHTAWLLGLTRKDFGNVEAGGDTGLQPNTGYDEWDGDAKVQHWLDDDARLTIAHMRVDQNDVPRTHTTRDAISFEGTSIGSDIRRDLDQDRSLTYVKLDTFGDVTSSTTLSFQQQKETQYRTRSNGRMDEQGFDVQTFGFSSVYGFDNGPGQLTAGIEWYHDRIDSFLDRFSQQTVADDIQGPVADDANYDLLGLFAQQELEVGERTDLTAGVRWTYAAAESDKVRDPVTNTRIGINEDWNQVTGSLRLDHALDEARTAVVFGGISQGFRAPNFSDLSRFDSARTNEFEIPATDLDPETFVQFELGAKHEVGAFSAQASAYYTLVDDVIQRFPTGNVNTNGETEITKANVGDGEVYGFEVGLAYELDDDWTAFGDLAWLDGNIETVEVAGSAPVEDSLTRRQPTTVHAGVRYEPADRGYFGEAMVTWADDATDLSLSDQRDSSRIPPGGTPGYTVIDLRGGYTVAKGWDLVFGVENVTDEDYRVHGSGSNRVGRNLYFGFTWSF
ncbi:MAG: TonB-dependent receptor [Planctomycetota bacterium]